MSVSIAEYLGDAVDRETHIIPSKLGGKTVPTCPFSGSPCIKLVKKQHPICSVRIWSRDADGVPFIVCSNRLIPAQAKTLTSDHIRTLDAIAKVLFVGANSEDIGFRRQVGVSLGKGNKNRLNFDYILGLRQKSGDSHQFVILEVQGGGETSSTGTITRHVTEWIDTPGRTLQFLSQDLNTRFLREHLRRPVGKVNVPGPIFNNAWKRQLDQIIKKALIARHHGGAFALVVGEALYDYITRNMPPSRLHYEDWEVAFISVGEGISKSAKSLDLTSIKDVSFMSFEDFMTAIQEVDVTKVGNPFLGEYETIDNDAFSI